MRFGAANVKLNCEKRRKFKYLQRIRPGFEIARPAGKAGAAAAHLQQGQDRDKT